MSEKNIKKISMYQKAIKYFKQFATKTGNLDNNNTQLDSHSDFEINQLKLILERNIQNTNSKSFIQKQDIQNTSSEPFIQKQDIQNTDSKSFTQEPEGLNKKSNNKQSNKFLDKIKPKSSYEEVRNKLASIRFLSSGVATTIAIYLVNSEASYILTGFLAGIVAGLLQYNQPYILYFLQQSIKIKISKKNFKIFFDKLKRSSNFNFYQKSFLISVAYLLIVQVPVNIIDKNTIISFEEMIHIFEVSFIGTFLIGPFENVNSRMLYKAKKDFFDVIINKIKLKQGHILELISKMENKIKSADCIDMQEFLILKERYKKNSSNALMELVNDKMLSKKTKTDLVDAFVKSKIESHPDWFENYHKIKSHSSYRTIFGSSLLVTLSLTSLVYNDWSFLTLDPFEWLMLILGPVALVIYNLYERFRMD